MRKPKICVLRTGGTNCDRETAFAFLAAGAQAELVHINRFISGESSLEDFQILAIPGGFTYGDDIAAGRVLANELRYKLGDDIKKFIQEKKLIIGICNGFQVLVKSGLLPGNEGFRPEASLIINDSGKFEDRWTYLRSATSDLRPTKCIWTKNLPEIIYLPVAHGEGKFVVEEKRVLGRLRKKGQIIFRYCDEKGESCGYPYNPNGSVYNIAGICDETGRILGLMPHPERHIGFKHHPRWRKSKSNGEGDGLQIFRNGVEYIMAERGNL